MTDDMVTIANHQVYCPEHKGYRDECHCPPLYSAVGVRAPWWAERTKSQPETMFREGMPLPEALEWARMMSISHLDDGAVDFWPEVGGHTEVRAGTVMFAAYVAGRKFNPDQWAQRQKLL